MCCDFKERGRTGWLRAKNLKLKGLVGEGVLNGRYVWGDRELSRLFWKFNKSNDREKNLEEDVEL
jgi:hypothetical protein